MDEDMRININNSIKWTRGLFQSISADKDIKFNKNEIRECLYRPFVKNYVYFDRPICHEPYSNKKIFPNENSENICLTFTTKDSYKFDILAINKLSDLHTTLYGTINAPLYVYENGEKKLNITDYAIKEFQNKYKDKATVENIFAYCHAVLSSPKYQKEYEENLKIDYPRIPLYKNFDRFVELGKRLIKLQTEFENFDCRK